MWRTGPAVIGLLAGIYSAGALLFRAHTIWPSATALLAPIVAGAWAATREARRARHELDVDEAVGVGATVGLVGGFILSVPFSLLVTFYAARQTEAAGVARAARAMGTAVTVGLACMLLLVFLTLSVLAAVVAARVSARTE